MPTSGPRGSAPSAPRNTEEARTLLQARLSQFGRIGMIVASFFFVIALTMNLVMPLSGAGGTIVAQGVSALVGATLWLATRRARWSERALLWFDFVATLANCAVFMVGGWTLPIWARPELVQLIAVTDILVLRAFLVPSTMRRTLVLSSFAVSCVVVSTWFLYLGNPPNPAAPGPHAYAAVAAVMGSASVILTSLTSRTIFGLRERVREATELGQYTLLEKIGEGGMGIVYKARHAMLRRPTAIKLLPPDRAGEHNLARFEREVQLTSQLTHPNTVSIYDYGRTADGVFYYAMEYLSGVDLEALVALDGPQAPGRVIDLMRQICGALEEAHSLGLIHRDIKPANVLVSSRGAHGELVKVLDFGLVKSIAQTSDPGATGVDQVVGTPLYLSPEAISAPDQVDTRGDIYALGALGYFLLVGEPPFIGRTALEVCGHHLHSQPKPPSERLGRPALAVDHVILRCLEKQPSARPENATAVAQALEACSDQPPWSSHQSAEWWKTKAQAIEQHRANKARPESSSGRDQTVAVDLRQREPSPR
jgi:eukaryotic-like serine/threonine-protein kinase